MARGGKRAGAGRKSSPESKVRTEAALRALTSGLTPLDIMLEAMRKAYESGGAKEAMPFAIAAAPYMHPKLANIDAKTTATATIVIEGALAKT